jgi:hypothetical protein
VVAAAPDDDEVCTAAAVVNEYAMTTQLKRSSVYLAAAFAGTHFKLNFSAILLSALCVSASPMNAGRVTTMPPAFDTCGYKLCAA